MPPHSIGDMVPSPTWVCESFSDLAVWKSTGHVFCSMSIMVGFSDAFLTRPEHVVMGFRIRQQTEMKALSHLTLQEFYTTDAGHDAFSPSHYIMLYGTESQNAEMKSETSPPQRRHSPHLALLLSRLIWHNDLKNKTGQDLHKIKPVNISTWIRERPCGPL